MEADHSYFARMFEQNMLKLDKLTPHQEAKLTECLQEDATRVHIVAPAGAGKTFLALHIVFEYLHSTCEDDDACVLLVAKNRALAFFFAKWLYSRDHGPQLLQRLYLLYEPLVTLQPHRVIKQGLKLVAAKSSIPPPRFGMVCMDEAHHLFSMAEQRASSILDRFCSLDEDHDVRLVLMSDVSQSRDKTIKYPSGLRKLELTEVVRNSERIVLAASAFQLQEDKSNHVQTSSQHGVTGPPLASVLFDEKSEPGSPEWFEAYAKNVIKALSEKVISRFGGLNLHDRLAILVPDDTFKKELAPRLSVLLESDSGRKFKLVSADEASEAVASSSGDVSSSNNNEEWLVLETMERFDGLERLIVMAVGMDQAGAAIRGLDDKILLQTRSLLYRALTRAHMFVCVVNVQHKEGLLSFLMHVKLEADARSSKAHNVVPLTAQTLMDSQEEQTAVPSASVEADARSSKAHLTVQTLMDSQEEQTAVPSACNDHQEASEPVARESVRHTNIDAYVLEKARRSKEKKAGKKKKKLIPNNLWDTSCNDDVGVPAALPDFMPFDLGNSRIEEEEEQKVCANQKYNLRDNRNLFVSYQESMLGFTHFMTGLL